MPIIDSSNSKWPGLYTFYHKGEEWPELRVLGYEGKGPPTNFVKKGRHCLEYSAAEVVDIAKTQGAQIFLSDLIETIWELEADLEFEEEQV